MGHDWSFLNKRKQNKTQKAESTAQKVGPVMERNNGLGNHYLGVEWASPVVLVVKNLPAMQETWIRSLGREDPLEKGMATHSSILAWRIPGTEEPGGLQSMGLHRVRQN